jgi:paraquat-inducible protein B
MSDDNSAGRAPGNPYPEARVVTRKQRRLPSLVWAVPVVAALIGGWIAVHAILNRGPTVEISFKTAEGIEAGKTKIKYKNVDVGEVKSVSLSDDYNQVLVKAELARNLDNALVADTRFWVVRPRVSGSSVSGLSTLLSGSYIGIDLGKKGGEQTTHFTGLESPPIVTGDAPGRQFVLHAEDIGSLDIGSPIYFRHIQVGKVVGYDLDPDGKNVTLKVFIDQPYDKYVTTNARFWQASGFDVTLDATGVKVDTESVASILAGGVAFQAPSTEDPGEPAGANWDFNLAADRQTAMRQPDTIVQHNLIYFKESLRGLTIGAPVDFRGIVIGEVKSVGVEYDRDAGDFKFPVEVNIYPNRLRSRFRPGSKPLDDENGTAFVTRLVERGLRAQLKTGNLLTGQLYVSLDFFKDAPKANYDTSRDPPVLPSVPGSLAELQSTLEQIVKKLGKIPYDDIAADVQQTVRQLDTTLKTTDKVMNQVNSDIGPEAKAALENARRALGAAEQTLSTDAPLQSDLRATLRDMRQAADSLKQLTNDLDRRPETLIYGKPEDPK